MALLDRAKYSEALTVFEKARFHILEPRAAPETVECLYAGLAAALSATRNLAEASNCFNKLLSVNPDFRVRGFISSLYRARLWATPALSLKLATLFSELRELSSGPEPTIEPDSANWTIP
jgi:tetratricopeptide (TPR) repeat protein